jgi:UDP-2,3-diacylglucosamine pyrophosphatase LpxH
MRRIKLVVSDFHIGFGRVKPDGSVNALEDFVSDQAFIDLLEYYRTGEFADAEVEVVLNGDIFECLISVDPEESDPDMITAAKSVEKIGHIVAGHREMFDALRVFTAGENRQVTFIVGNHDQDLLWEEVRELLKREIHADIRFFDEPYRFDGVHIEHGHQYELNNRWDPERKFLTKGLSEPILNLPWGTDLFINCLLKVKRARPYVNRVRPFRQALMWSVFHDLGIVLRGLWAFFAAIFKARFRKLRQRRITFLHTLRLSLKFDAFPTLEKAAKRLLRSGSVQTVIFGHTHLPMMRQPLPGKIYVNSGSWIPTSNLHISGLGRNLLQTYVYVEYDGDIPRAHLKLWHGRRVVEEDVII